MLIVSKRRQRTFYAPLLPYAFGGVVLYGIAQVRNPTGSVAFGVLVGLLLLGFGVSQTTVATLVDETLVVKSPFRRVHVDGRVCVFEIKRVGSGRGGEWYEVYVRDASTRAKVCAVLFPANAEWVKRKLEACLTVHVSEHADARASVERLLAAERAEAEMNIARVNELLQSPSFWTPARAALFVAWLLVSVGSYFAFMLLSESGKC